MRTHLLLGLFVGLPMALASGRAGAADATLDQTLACMRANIPPSVRIQTVEVDAWDRTGGQRTLKAKLYGIKENNRARIMLRIDAPTDLAGAAYLVREGETMDEMYLYLPSLQKVRRITGASMDGQLWGTDLSYNDLKQIQNAFSGADVTMDPAPAKYEARDVRVLSFKPRKEDASRYTTIRAQIDTQTCVPLSVEFIDQAGVRKTLAVKPADVKQSNARWYAEEAEIKDTRNGTRTRLKVTGVIAGDKLAGRYFSPQTFYLGN